MSVLKIAIAPNAFRGSLTALEAAVCIERGLKASNLECETVLMPLADGGDGTLDVWLSAQEDSQVIEQEVMGPLGNPVDAKFGLAGKRALIEMARASGIQLLAPHEYNPLKATTYGTGQLIRQAIEMGASEVLVGIGGSATVDGGAGCLQALGVELLDEKQEAIGYGGGALAQLAHINVKPVQTLLEEVTLRILCDVDNPLVGESGAALVFGPQKGATPEMVRQLDKNLNHYADIIRRDLGEDIRHVAGTGAAGGLSAGLMAMGGAVLVSGVQALIEACDYDDKLTGVQLVITGEGKLDSQTKGGKAPFGIAKEAHSQGIPVVALAGAVTASIHELQQWGIQAAWSIVSQACTLDEALSYAAEWLVEAATNLGNMLALGGMNDD